MDCRACGVVNAPGRRYCRECGSRLGQPCPVCHFFNAVEDKHCGGCGRRLKSEAEQPGTPLGAVPSHVPAFLEDEEFGAAATPPARRGGGDASAEQGVSQSEIDGLFENILDDEPEESPEGGA